MRARIGRPGRLSWLRAAALIAALAVFLGAVQASVPEGNRLVNEGSFAEAVEAYESALERNENDARAHHRLARALVYLADSLPAGDDDERETLFDRASDHAERATALAPEDPDAHFEVARALGRLAQYRGVLQSLNLASRVASALDRTLELDPDHAAAWHARAIFHHEVPWIAGGRGGRVVPSFERAIEIEPDVLSHRVEFARVLIERGSPDAAAEQLAVALTLTPRTYHDHQDLAKAEELLAELQ